MKKNLLMAIIAFFVVSLFIVGQASAQGMMGARQVSNSVASQGSAIDMALQVIFTDQGITDTKGVNCSKVTDEQFEKLGDAYMGSGITEQQHEAMEQMMGGEGSATLKQAHITMGRSYLGCWSNFNASPYMMPMMGYFSANYGARGAFFPGSMMGYTGGFSWFGMVTMLLVWALLILGIIVLVKSLLKGKK